MKLVKDFGVRALLATIALICFEGMLFTALAFLYQAGELTAQLALTIGGLAQAPAMLALGFYFGAKSTPPPSPNP